MGELTELRVSPLSQTFPLCELASPRVRFALFLLCLLGLPLPPLPLSASPVPSPPVFFFPVLVFLSFLLSSFMHHPFISLFISPGRASAILRGRHGSGGWGPRPGASLSLPAVFLVPRERRDAASTIALCISAVPRDARFAPSIHAPWGSRVAPAPHDSSLAPFAPLLPPPPPISFALRAASASLRRVAASIWRLAVPLATEAFRRPLGWRLQGASVASRRPPFVMGAGRRWLSGAQPPRDSLVSASREGERARRRAIARTGRRGRVRGRRSRRPGRRDGGILSESVLSRRLSRLASRLLALSLATTCARAHAPSALFLLLCASSLSSSFLSFSPSLSVSSCALAPVCVSNGSHAHMRGRV